MENIKRFLTLKDLISKKSLFLFGPRSTGKTTLLKDEFGSENLINLLRGDVFLRLSQNPSEVREIIESIAKKQSNAIIIIDEIQRIPELLNEVHDLIESTDYRFILTGSSARKLKRGGVNLLAGRAWQTNLFPLTANEIGDHFNLEKYLLYGGLPQVNTSQYPIEELDAYINTYLKEEIKEESLVQNLGNFSRFLKFAAISNCKSINYSSLSQETGIPASTIRSFFEILSETFLGFTLSPWQESKKRRPVSTGKFYFFDVGVANYLRETRSLDKNSSSFGDIFEHWIAMELRAYISYKRIKKELMFWRTLDKVEVDFIIENECAIEVKSSSKIIQKHLKGLNCLISEGGFKNYIMVSFDPIEKTTKEKIRCIPWNIFIKELWAGKLF